MCCIPLYLHIFIYVDADNLLFCSEKKCIRSQEYAAEHGLPILKNVLLPKTKGFNCCLQELRGSLDAGKCPYSILHTILLLFYIRHYCSITNLPQLAWDLPNLLGTARLCCCCRFFFLLLLYLYIHWYLTPDARTLWLVQNINSILIFLKRCL